MTEVRTPAAQRSMNLYNEIQLCREMGWSQAELDAADDEFVWAALRILDFEGKKHDRESRGPGSSSGGRPANPNAIAHHQQSAPPTRVPD